MWNVHEGWWNHADPKAADVAVNKDWASFRKLQANCMPPEQRATFEDTSKCMALHYRNADCDEHNNRSMVEGFSSGKHPGIALVPAHHVGPQAKKGAPADYNGLEADMFFVLYAPMMLITNLFTEAGLTNGLAGTLVALLCEEDPWEHPPAVALLKVERSKVRLDLVPDVWPDQSERDVPDWGRAPCEHCNHRSKQKAAFKHLPDHRRPHECLELAGSDESGAPLGKALEKHPWRYCVLPIPRVDREWEGKNCTRSTLPLRLAFGITIHKSQGMTLERVLLNAGEYERMVGLMFTGLSRVGHEADIALVGNLDLMRLMRIRNNKRLIQRRAWEGGFARPREDALLVWMQRQTPGLPADTASMPAFCETHFAAVSPPAR